ncbi:aspartyl beta-hydroxylase [Pseudomonas sp. AOB-7]|uniref:aspartyl/asparaginyl beta-hydroxylase domain-containing protein n=1 Tax=Pseudomonas sp. AOB-7 TaxID=2482750 RepID=UPI000EFD0C86|nr:aspartyl/asparaginyl beta-hydroxylase domain-containing protein [Pseudomonas sp. AOB-7]RMH83613.1 aspartyl beta-hydroxylase [Pseudomonas sp. AOB-7]
MAHHALPACSRLPLQIELAALLAALARVQPDAWQQHFNRDYYQGDWSGVTLIGAADAPLPLAPGRGAAQASAWWQENTAWHQLLAAFRAPLRSVRLLRLGPGARIHEHCDPDLGQPDADLRLHVPLLSPPGVEFLLDGLQVPMQPGECWFLDLSRPHRVDNPSRQPRIHLVLDCAPCDWLLETIGRGLGQTPALRPSRGEQAFADLRERLAQQPELAAHLRSLSDTRDFIDATLRLGEQLGLPFSEAEVRRAMRQGKQTWNDQWRA